MDHPYRTLGIAVVLHLVIMFVLTFSGVNALDDVFVNLNRFYMAVLMVAPMVIVMLALMHHMYGNERLNIALYAVAALVFVGTFAEIGSQTFVGDRQFLRR